MFNISTEKISLSEKISEKTSCCSEKIGGETEKMNEIITEQIEFPEIMQVDTELISEQINDYTEKIGTNSEQIDDFPEIIPEKITEKKRYRGQRGQDKVPRRLNYNSIMNLKPFKSNAITLERETTTMGLSNNEIRIIGIVLLTAIVGIVIWKIIEWLKEPVKVTEWDF
ncbi:MAG: hypothetical protein OEW78_07195 [Nitrosopumilus sp.]|uniref:hypothetical protein n=1 Tax=Nitrosopumilus sp. TaxID=2024843 RepID=UPI00246C2EF2|nr:hypothetical protein [Nitrosopumilus sp.]MDH5431650.1 hypothetical protein [Nitrosopumilus sp.]